jgi:hypothetical protein
MKQTLKLILGLESLLLVPMLAQLFSNAVQWSLFDFIVMGVLLLGLATGITLVYKMRTNKNIRRILLLVVLILFFILWAELAVGLFGSPLAGN